MWLYTIDPKKNNYRYKVNNAHIRPVCTKSARADREQIDKKFMIYKSINICTI